MSRFLFATQPITGHLLPAIPIVSEMVRRGHEVVWYAGQKFRTKVEATGARFAPYVQAKDYDDDDYNAAFPGRANLKGLNQIKFDFIHLFIRQIAPQHRDLQAILAGFKADVIIGDPSVFATFTVNDTGGPPNVVYNITVLGIKGRDVAPFGLGILPNASSIGRVRNRLLQFMATNVVFKTVSAEMLKATAEVGGKPRKFEGVLCPRYLLLEPTVSAFEYPRSDLPPQVHFIGALLPDTPKAFTPPAWWDEVIRKTKPVVLVTQGTVATDQEQLIAPTLKALANEDVLVIAAGVKDKSALGAIPANAHVEAFVPFALLMPHIDVYITNGGYGGVSIALANGVPLITGGITEDKPEVGNRVAYSGVGINLKTATPTPVQVKEAVQKILHDSRYRERARQIQADFARYDAPNEAARLLEQLAKTQQPVFRRDAVTQQEPGKVGNQTVKLVR